MANKHFHFSKWSLEQYITTSGGMSVLLAVYLFQRLMSEDRWFQFLPFPGGHWRVTVKDEPGIEWLQDACEWYPNLVQPEQVDQ